MTDLFQDIETFGNIVVAGNRAEAWFQALLLIVAGVVIARVGARLLRRLLPRMAKWTATDVDDEIAEGAVGPISASLLLPFIVLAASALSLPDGVRTAIDHGVRIAFGIFLALLGLRVADAVFRVGLEPWLRHHRPDFEFGLLDLGRKITRMLVVLLLAVSTLRAVGFDVVSLITGLGIGGLAVALAAQETLGNVLGSLQIMTDQPFVRGDFVRVESIIGRVIEVGLRSTKVLTSAGVRVVIPNKKLAELPIENLSIYNGLSVETSIGLTYATGADAVERAQVLLIEAVRSVPGTHEEVRAHFLGYGPYSLDLALVYFVVDMDRQLQIRHEVNVGIKRAFDAAGLDFAFPTQTLHLEMAQRGGPLQVRSERGS
jgi:MscS family membrane protein